MSEVVEREVERLAGVLRESGFRDPVLLHASPSAYTFRVQRAAGDGLWVAKVLRTLGRFDLEAGLPRSAVIAVPEVECLIDGTRVAVRPYLEAGSLSDVASRQGGLSVLDSLQLVAKVAAALDAVHERGFVHGDIKPHNILLRDDQATPVLIDFGMAHEEGHGSTVGGTPEYRAPEVAQVGTSRASDVYALGATLYALLTGRPPSSGGATEADLDAVNEVFWDKESGRFVTGVLAPVLDREPAARPTAGELAARLRDVAARYGTARLARYVAAAKLRYEGDEVTLGEDQAMTVGRGGGGLVVAPTDGSVSRRAIEVSIRAGTLLVRNISQANVINVITPSAEGQNLWPGDSATVVGPLAWLDLRGSSTLHRIEITAQFRDPVPAREDVPMLGPYTEPPPHDPEMTGSQVRLLAAYCEPLLTGRLAPASHLQAGARLGISPNTARNRIQDLVRQHIAHGVLPADADKDALCRWAVRSRRISAAELTLLPPEGKSAHGLPGGG